MLELKEIWHGTTYVYDMPEKSMILPVQESKICCDLDFHAESQPRNVLKMFLDFQEIEPIVLIKVFLYKKNGV